MLSREIERLHRIPAHPTKKATSFDAQDNAYVAKQGSGDKNRKPPVIAAAGSPSDDGKNSVDPVGGEDHARRKSPGGLRVDYRDFGADELRSLYDPSSLAIFINLDHPVVAAALGQGGVEEPAFRRLSYEIALRVRGGTRVRNGPKRSRHPCG